jgi:hypothetical protein
VKGSTVFLSVVAVTLAALAALAGWRVAPMPEEAIVLDAGVEASAQGALKTVDAPAELPTEVAAPEPPERAHPETHEAPQTSGAPAGEAAPEPAVAETPKPPDLPPPEEQVVELEMRLQAIEEFVVKAEPDGDEQPAQDERATW